MTEMMNWIANEEDGQGMVEYALILALISVAAIAAIKLIGPKVSELFESASNELATAKP